MRTTLLIGMLALNVFACGPGEQTEEQSAGEGTAGGEQQGGGSAPAPDVPWAQKDLEARKRYMASVVLPRRPSRNR